MKISLFLLVVSAVYLTLGMIDIFVYRFAPVELLQIGYVIVLFAPIVFKRHFRR